MGNKFPSAKKNKRDQSKPSEKMSDSVLTNITSERKMSSGSARRKRAMSNKLDTFRQEVSYDDHKLSLDQIQLKYRTSLSEGLSRELAARMLVKYGRNVLEVIQGKNMVIVFLQFMFGGFAAVLWICGILSLIGFIVNYMTNPECGFDELYLSIVILIIVVGTGIFGFLQEYSSSKLIDGFQKMVPKNAMVIRGGAIYNISVEEIVPGDLVKLEGGDSVPADIRIIECHGLKVDNSSITGESEPQSRGVAFTDENPLETANLAFFSTNVIEGSGKGIVIATGQNTLIGHIASLTSGLAPEITPMKREVKRFIKFITIYSLVVSSFFFFLGIGLGYGVLRMSIYFLGILVANVPEALPVSITASLTLMARKMTSKNCMVRNMQAVETLGQTNVICSDKTGTLTQNRMTVSHMYYDSTIFDVLSPSYVNGTSSNYLYLCRCGILCSRAAFVDKQDKISVMERQVYGDASESAVLKCMELLTRRTKNVRRDFPKIFEIPFNSTNKYQVSIHKRPSDQVMLLVMKGAPERILDRCASIMHDEEELPMTEIELKRLSRVLMELGYMGERVLAFADLKLPSEYTETFAYSAEQINFPVVGLRLVGFMSMIDPPRPGVLDAVQRCHRAGIRVIMVTGDHPITAMSIARKVGIISPENDTVQDIAKRRKISVTELNQQDLQACKASVISGTDLRHMSTEALEELVMKYPEIVFARTSPQQKLQIVEAFQRNGNIVAVTGDGVNDSPALKKADIGIAMGISGSDVSKDAADLVLLDDNFSSIVSGIEEGRLIYDNLKKSIAYLLTSNIPEVVPFVIYVVCSTPKIITVMAVLIIDVGTDLWPGISLAYEPPESDIMNLPPRNPKFDNLVGMKLILFCYLDIGTTQTLAALSTWFFVMSQYGFRPNRLMGIQQEWNSEANDVLDSYGYEWTREDRMILERLGVSAYFLGLVVTQIVDALVTKTRRLSLAQHGMGNTTMIKGLMFETFLACFVVYFPYVNTMLGFEPVNVYFLVPCIPFALIIFFYDELRKYIIRHNPDGWFYWNTYY